MAVMGGKGQELNRTGVSEFFGVALNTVDAWVRQGCPVVQRGSGKGVPWKFNSADIANWLRAKAKTDALGDTPADEAELKRRKLAAETETAELTLAKARGEVASIRDFERAQAAVFAQIRANVMNAPQRLVLQLLGETDETTFKTKMRAELAKALEDAANADLVMADDDDQDGDGA